MKNPGFWYLLKLGTLFRLIRLYGQGFGFVSYLKIATIIPFAVLHSTAAVLTQAIYRKRLEHQEFCGTPIFEIGFWRSGTTWLHRILVHSPTYCSPSMVQCYAPESFLLAQPILRQVMSVFVPKRRKMDIMTTGVDYPEEDEAAIAMMGLASPFLKPFFPSHYKLIDDVAKTEMQDSARRENWTSKWLVLLKRVQYVNPGSRLVLKSPAHSTRIPLILDVFPDAKFIHITRNPIDTISSNLLMEDSLHSAYGFEPSDLKKTDRVKQTLVGFSHFHKKMQHDLDHVPEKTIFKSGTKTFAAILKRKLVPCSVFSRDQKRSYQSR